MADPVLPDSGIVTRAWRRPGAPGMLLVLLELALALRVLAAEAVEWYVRGGGSDRLCLFRDTDIYWELARTIRASAPYQIVEWGDIPHFALRTPGYPIVLAACQALFGERTLPVRLVQAVLGTCSVYLVYRLASQLVPSGEKAEAAGPDDRAGAAGRPGGIVSSGKPAAIAGCAVPLCAAALAAFNPYYIFMSAILLSEAIFEPLMLAALWGLAVLWPRPMRAGEGGRIGNPSYEEDPGRLRAGEGGTSLPPARAGGWPIEGLQRALVALGSGAAAGMAVLVRPSWWLFVPVAVGIWVLAQARTHRTWGAARGMILWLFGAAMVMGPWWARNAQVYGRFVPTALWMGASLYDGLNPQATGASDMSFLGDPDIWPLDEEDQDTELTRRALRFVREHPGRALGLAVVKLGRFWSPWPNAEGFGGWPLAVAGAAVELPLFGLLAAGAWDRRRDLRVWVLSAGPLLYFCAVHLIFASSMRYRLPGEMAALALAGFGLLALWNRWRMSPPLRRVRVRLRQF